MHVIDSVSAIVHESRRIDSFEVDGTSAVAIRSLMLHVAHNMGIFGADAEDVAQQALFELLRDVGRGLHRNGDGSLRSWGLAIARHRAIDVRRCRRRESALARDAARCWRTERAPPSTTSATNTNRRAAILRAAIDELRETSGTSERTLAIFAALVAGSGIERVVADCGLQAAHVHRIKHRILARVRPIALRLESQWRDEEP